MKTSNSFHVVRCRVKMGTIINYCYLVINLSSGSCVAIDPAWDRSAIEEKLLSFGVKLAGILVTHHHPDHIDLASILANKYGCKIHLSDIEYIYYSMRLEPVVLLKDRASFTLGGMSILPILTPGHTAGSACFLFDNVLFTGDTLFNEGTGLCFSKGGDPVQMFHSVQTLKRLIPDDTIIYPGHRYRSDLGMTFGQVKQSNLYLQIEDVDQFVEIRMRKKKNLFNFT